MEYELPKVTPITHDELIRHFGVVSIHQAEQLTKEEEEEQRKLAEEINDIKREV